MHLAHPVWVLPALVAAALLVWFFTRLWRARHRHDLVYSDVAFFEDAAAPRAFPVRVLAGAALAGVALLALSVAGPHLVLPVPAKDGAVMVCIDTSGSMASTDVDPDRARAALAAAKAFIDAAPEGTKIGIIAFSTSASVVAPLTTDRAALTAALQNVPPPNGATAIGDALALSSQALGSTGHRAIVLITDGVNNRGADPDAVTSDLASRHIRVNTVGIGTNGGSIIPGTNEEATIDEDALRRYAQTTGGRYASAQSASQLRDILANLGSTTTMQQRDVDATLACALAGAALLAATVLAYLGIGRMSA